MKHALARIAALTLLVAAGFGLYFSCRYLPPINEEPPWTSDRESQNWIGQGGRAFAVYGAFLLLMAYSVKRVIVTRCSTATTALYFFSVAVLLSLPYIWFLCEPDWFNPFLYRISCWVGAPLAIWLIPMTSFVADLSHLAAPASLRHYLARSAVELAIFPVWLVFWVYFSFFVLGWGWL